MLTVASFRPSFFNRVVLKRALQTLAAVLVMTTATMLHAQATAAAEKTSDISGFILFTRLCPDYGPTNNNGFTVGGDYLLRNRIRWFDPGVEVRFRSADGATVGEKYFAGGLKVEKVIGNFHPYGNVLLGRGSINYYLNPQHTLVNGQKYTSDSSGSLGVGGGLDYPIKKGFSVRAEYQHEWWRSMKTFINPQDPQRHYTGTDLVPYAWSFGVAYTIPFRPFVR